MSEGHVGYFVRFDSVGMMILGVWQAYTSRKARITVLVFLRI